MTCYLTLDFRPTYFSYFQKIIAISRSHNVKKEVNPKDAFPVVKGLKAIFRPFTKLSNQPAQNYAYFGVTKLHGVYLIQSDQLGDVVVVSNKSFM